MRNLNAGVFYLDQEVYRDKVYACWLGKNMGGTIGAPFEGYRQINDIQGFSTPENVVLPNDDLDLQLVWLHAMEEFGPTGLSPQVMGENWLSFETLNSCEYGIAKANMRLGLQPPLSGAYNNDWKNSNGAWIRTEIWASLCPATPDAAAQYAYFDAAVDHGHGEGTYAAAFVAAMESAAFVIDDLRTLIDIGMARIPQDCRVARTVRLLLKCYDSGMSWLDARNAVLEENMDIGTGWFEAPSNVGYTLLGLLYGEGDFKKTLIIAVNCGDDTDCTAGTAGALMGIMHGTGCIPADWKRHIGDTIVTVSIDRGTLLGIPETCTELTQRVVNLAPSVLQGNYSCVQLGDIATDSLDLLQDSFYSTRMRAFFESAGEYCFSAQCGMATAMVCYDGSPAITPGQTRKLRIRFARLNHDLCGIHSVRFKYTMLKRNFHGYTAHVLTFRWLTEDGWAVTGPQTLMIPAENTHTDGFAWAEFTVTAPETVGAVNRLVLEVTVPGRHSAGYVSIPFVG